MSSYKRVSTLIYKKQMTIEMPLLFLMQFCERSGDWRELERGELPEKFRVSTIAE
jgi:hypothetical protein